MWFLEILFDLVFVLYMISYKFVDNVNFDELFKLGCGYDDVDDDLFVVFFYILSLFNVWRSVC